ncbi:hypothetical protein R3P38DRAFT_1512566 [Favolaschia claudopus]|uniref:Uncharacterized protein n=1 Tax=Favolaschia claudopus TaxID=2862362 RepID=A0AAW0AKS0_9AGAR
MIMSTYIRTTLFTLHHPSPSTSSQAGIARLVASCVGGLVEASGEAEARVGGKVVFPAEAGEAGRGGSGVGEEKRSEEKEGRGKKVGKEEGAKAPSLGAPTPLAVLTYTGFALTSRGRRIRVRGLYANEAPRQEASQPTLLLLLLPMAYPPSLAAERGTGDGLRDAASFLGFRALFRIPKGQLRRRFLLFAHGPPMPRLLYDVDGSAKATRGFSRPHLDSRVIVTGGASCPQLLLCHR